MIRLYHQLQRRIRRLRNLLRWLYPELQRNGNPFDKSGKRILAVWDFRVVPFTVGELLVCQELALVLRELRGVDKIDLVLLCDETNPARPDGGMNSRNFHYYFSKLLPAAFVNPHLGNLFIMDSPAALTAFIADNAHRYYSFPPYLDSRNRALTSYEQYFGYIQTFYDEQGYIPQLSCREATVMWAHEFLSKTVGPRFPVVVHLRNRTIDLNRNAQLEHWFEFFSSCAARYEVIFVLIGEQDEIDPSFRRLSNILISKDYVATVEQDLALIQTAGVFMGTDSGPICMAFFNRTPYLIYSLEKGHKHLSRGQSLPWATPLQKLVWEPETKEGLIADFSWLYERIDKESWRKEFDQGVARARTCLKRREASSGITIEGRGSEWQTTLNLQQS